jgi:hypothetical protein
MLKFIHIYVNHNINGIDVLLSKSLQVYCLLCNLGINLFLSIDASCYFFIIYMNISCWLNACE